MKLRKNSYSMYKYWLHPNPNKKGCFKFNISRFSEKDQIIHKFSGNPFRKVPVPSCLKQEFGELCTICSLPVILVILTH